MNDKPRAIFIVGAPASGKSTVRDRLLSQDEFVFIDCDIMRAKHPDYDPKDPEILSKLHPWVKVENRKWFLDTLQEQKNMTVEGTAANTEEFCGLLKLAREARYVVELIYVRCSLETALDRNENRERTIDESLLREKYAQTLHSIDIVGQHADSVTVIDND